MAIVTPCVEPASKRMGAETPAWLATVFTAEGVTEAACGGADVKGQNIAIARLRLGGGYLKAVAVHAPERAPSGCARFTLNEAA
jgi:hypothetical protein